MVVEQTDEIQRFIDARYVSASEACWRLFSFSLHDEFPKHQRLTIHLPGEEPVYFDEDDQAEDVLNRPTKDTTLTAWFKANVENEYARQYLYIEFPEKYVWHKKDSEWKIRKRNLDTTIGQIYSISPRETEK
ncbi:hypothetical protein A0J61_03046 [Choanephora cucurbitarum]|uniref:Uncharacterized protein n=1 Tax=Choanephora cucurbitarum TaxID=101091 RepID=A0A1C7NIT6_9FUNG|nr:hypothetical protein A0J61_03046 [Choanephora cucurbitarum]